MVILLTIQPSSGCQSLRRVRVQSAAGAAPEVHAPGGSAAPTAFFVAGEPAAWVLLVGPALSRASVEAGASSTAQQASAKTEAPSA
ncbi:hypothetical protein [uncultured Methylobacterium sp.]|uniref:hypothetical protein n=1 Tax=uncultured Methylobacterium sp. TaxID=157278 RepID=UPI0035CBDAAB